MNCFISFFFYVISPEPKAPVELKGWNGSGVGHPSTLSNAFFSETTKPMLTKFHMKPPGVGETKSSSDVLGFMSNMAAAVIYGKNL